MTSYRQLAKITASCIALTAPEKDKGERERKEKENGVRSKKDVDVDGFRCVGPYRDLRREGTSCERFYGQDL